MYIIIFFFIFSRECASTAGRYEIIRTRIFKCNNTTMILFFRRRRGVFRSREYFCAPDADGVAFDEKCKTSSAAATTAIIVRVPYIWLLYRARPPGFDRFPCYCARGIVEFRGRALYVCCVRDPPAAPTAFLVLFFTVFFFTRHPARSY